MLEMARDKWKMNIYFASKSRVQSVGSTHKSRFREEARESQFRPSLTIKSEIEICIFMRSARLKSFQLRFCVDKRITKSCTISSKHPLFDTKAPRAFQWLEFQIQIEKLPRSFPPSIASPLHVQWNVYLFCWVFKLRRQFLAMKFKVNMGFNNRKYFRRLFRLFPPARDSPSMR
jgi:hypothetical protein